MRPGRNGRPRWEDGDNCQNAGTWRDIDGDVWCSFHAKRNLRQQGEADPWQPYKHVETEEVLALAS